MCFAPRYISGPIAAPRTDCRNTASLPDTPCAPTPGTSTSATSAIVRSAVRLRAALISLMARITRDIQSFSGFEHLLGTPGLRRLQHDAAGVDHRLRHPDPLTVVHAAAFHQQ